MSCSKKGNVDQLPPPPPPFRIQLDSSSFTIGNSEKNVLDTFVLHYNKPVTVNSILLISNICLPDIGRMIINNGRTVKFYNLLCAFLGRDYKFQVSVKDDVGQIQIDTVKFSYYNRRFPIEGQIMHYSISADNKFIWATTANPNRIVCMDIEDTTFKKIFDLSFKPRKFLLNPINQKFYILPYPFNEPNKDRIYIFNPLTGNIEKVLTVTKDIYDNPATQIEVYDLEFGFNGYGVINSGTFESSPSRWRIIDSRFNDSIYAHPEWIASNNGTGNTFYKEFASLQKNYNGTKIYMQMRFAFPRAGVLDCVNSNLTTLVFASSNPNHYIVPSKAEDKLFVASYGFQAIYNNGQWGNSSDFDNRTSETAEFSYRQDDNDVIYYRNQDNSYEFVVLDYGLQKVISRKNVLPDFSKINATTDGKYILAQTDGGLYLWYTNIFYKY
ncbi:hypothetical protein CAP36_08000 [Chitinophagaceae bacterium IBVUCB2]|nr:hypothetical protein CAP36_08000 [Chitinophagaceae bacterium IBVUCB2]